ncbi:MAG: GtrA family protein [Sphingomicrobium sp.]
MPDTGARLHRRLFSRRAGDQLLRNTVVSVFVFAIDIALLWLFVEFGGMNKLIAATIAFVIANSIHYGFGRSWIFRGTERKPVEGYAYFLINAGIGLAVTLALFAAFMALLPANYLFDRVLASVFSGLTVFVLNAVLNFRTL